MKKTEIMQEILEYLRGPRQKYVICHLSDIFTLITEGRSYVISKDAAEAFLKEHETDLIHFSLMQKIWNTKEQEFQGETDPLPEIFKGREVRTTEVDNKEVAETIIELMTKNKPFSLQTREVIEKDNHCISPGIFSVFY